MCHLLDIVEERQDPRFTEAVFKQVMTEVFRRLAEVRVIYPVPRRISLGGCMRLLQEYLAELSGGDRLLALTAALFVVIGRRFKLYHEVRRGNITSADQATGLTADLECVSEDNTIVLAVEVKDRALTISQLRGKIPSIRERGAFEVFFVAQQGVPKDEADETQALVDHEFISGHNIYITDLFALARVALALIGEESRAEFLSEVGKQLEQYHSDIQHRRAWARLLSTT